MVIFINKILTVLAVIERRAKVEIALVKKGEGGDKEDGYNLREMMILKMRHFLS